MEGSAALTWLGIAFCVLQSGCFSGLNLSLFGINALTLESQAAAGDKDAAQLLELRQDSNFLLSTVLWGNVGTNVLLTLLTESVLAGALGFIFSTFVITFGGEIIPQAYFSRNALRMATLMRPFLRLWQFLLYPIAKPTGLVLDAWLGGESILYLRERELREVLKRYVAAPETEIGEVEGIGALNFLALDDLSVQDEGDVLHRDSLLTLPEEKGQPVFPSFEPLPSDPFVRSVANAPGKWVVVTTPADEPLVVLDADRFLRATLWSHQETEIESFCHRPILVRSLETKIAEVLPLLRTSETEAGDHVIDHDLILVWAKERRVITGSDILGSLLRDIATAKP